MSCSCLSIHEFILDASLALGNVPVVCPHRSDTKCQPHAQMSQMLLSSVHKSSIKNIIALIHDFNVNIKIRLGLYINY